MHKLREIWVHLLLNTKDSIVSRMIFILFISMCFGMADADPRREAQGLIHAAEVSLDHFNDDPEMGKVRVLAQAARGFFIAPGVWEAGAGIGASGGKGILLVRDE